MRMLSRTNVSTRLSPSASLTSSSGLLLLAWTLLAGCAVMGRQQKENPVDARQVEQVKKGMTKGQVTSLLGAPNEIIFSNREHDPLREYAYIYEHVVTKYTGIVFGIINFGNAEEKKDRVVVFFDDDGRVDSLGASLYGHEASYGFPFGQ